MDIPNDLVILVLGSGGREHAIVKALSADPGVGQVHVAPGNPATAAIGVNHDVDFLNPHAVVALARQVGAHLVVPGPESTLVAGVTDALRAAGIPVFGPSAQAAQLEASKSFAKEVMSAAQVPTAQARLCRNAGEVSAALDEFGAPYVVKHDGLAAGKGVLVTTDIKAALEHAAGAQRVLVEEYLSGPEVSLFVVTDGIRALPMLPAQDFKRVGEADTGPNTGGMGAYCPLPWLADDVVDDVMAQVVHPTLAQLGAQGVPFVGLLYVGLVITASGPKVIEFNARFGDPETQVVLPLLRTPLGQVLYAAATGQLDGFDQLTFDEGAAVCVVLASQGYPASSLRGGVINLPADTDTAYVIQAGTRLENAMAGDQLVSNGGRVLAVVGLGEDVPAARTNAYQHVNRVGFAQGFWRRDIANDQRLAGGKISMPKEN